MTETSKDQLDAIERLLRVMSMLRDKNFGCPWDLEQSIASLASYTLEEVYEVIDAIEQGDMVELKDELGDLLFQIVFYAQIAREQGNFSFADIANAITNKLIRRHPHVFPEGDIDEFGKQSGITSDQVAVNWEVIKQSERDAKRLEAGEQNNSTVVSILDDVPRAMPALARAGKLQKRAANVGFDWPELQPVLAKLNEEIAEFEQALKSEGQERIEHELGDILFSIVNLARHSGIEPESALRAANQRFENRFKWIESTLRDRGGQLERAGLAELDRLWEEAKASGL